ncbi:MAG: hydrogenase maturation nickel metallochaperone HypA [Bacteroidia bacterium]|jgi:hydrogenase nickel incorporation protein HypA/HybF|nr:hydrogenase maturation nickel metallochaperone HypA [Bacteroidia bacterium]
MHELSLVLSIIEIAENHAQDAQSIDEIEIDIGQLSAVEMDAFEFAWKQGVKDTRLQNAIKIINRISGKGACFNCEFEFQLQNVYDTCPQCGSHFINILRGKEFKVKSILVS